MSSSSTKKIKSKDPMKTDDEYFLDIILNTIIDCGGTYCIQYGEVLSKLREKKIWSDLFYD